MSLLVPAYPGCPGSKAVKRSLLLLLLTLESWHIKAAMPLHQKTGGGLDQCFVFPSALTMLVG